jgi:glycosyltransferase involved in cell wall biosynthesis
VLVVTIAVHSGGVLTMNRWIAQVLHARGLEPVFAYYLPYSQAPELSRPLWKLWRGKPGARQERYVDCEAHAIGSYLPELEFTHNWPHAAWRKVVASCRYHLVVSGNPLPCLALAWLQQPFLAWIATPWAADRQDRVRTFGILRRGFDRMLVQPFAPWFERWVLRRGVILALSHYTQCELERLAGKPVVREVLPMPIDTILFHPQLERVVPGRLVFSGRFADPRKNLPLLLTALAELLRRQIEVELWLVGDELSVTLRQWLAARGVDAAVRVVGRLEHPQLAEVLQTADVFVLPSYQEGLCIAALEAMACGCPVISTRCGGPEEFVLDSETGYLVDFAPMSIAARVADLVRDRSLRDRLGQQARTLVLKRYSQDYAERLFWQSFDKTFGAHL